MIFRVLAPTPETAAPLGRKASRLDTLSGKTVGLISNGKEGTKGFFTHVEDVLRKEYGVAHIVLRTKPNYSAPAPAPIVGEIRSWDAVISGIGD